MKEVKKEDSQEHQSLYLTTSKHILQPRFKDCFVEYTICQKIDQKRAYGSQGTFFKARQSYIIFYYFQLTL